MGRSSWRAAHQPPSPAEEMDLLTAMAYRIALTLEQVQNKNQLEYIIRGNHKIGQHLEESAIEEEAVRAFPVIVSADVAYPLSLQG